MAKNNITFEVVIDDIIEMIPKIRNTIKNNRKKGLVDSLTVSKKNIMVQYDYDTCTLASVSKDGSICDIFSFAIDVRMENEGVISENYDLLKIHKNSRVEIPLELFDDHSPCMDISAYYEPTTRVLSLDIDGFNGEFTIENPEDSEAVMFALSTIQGDIVHPSVLTTALKNIHRINKVLHKNECIDFFENFTAYLPKNWRDNVLYPTITYE